MSIIIRHFGSNGISDASRASEHMDGKRLDNERRTDGRRCKEPLLETQSSDPDAVQSADGPSSAGGSEAQGSELFAPSCRFAPLNPDLTQQPTHGQTDRYLSRRNGC